MKKSLLLFAAIVAATALHAATPAPAKSQEKDSEEKQTVQTTAMSVANDGTIRFAIAGDAEELHDNITTPALSDLDGICDIEVTFRYRRLPKSSVEFRVSNAGVIKQYSLDDVEITLTDENYPYKGSKWERLRLENGNVPVFDKEVWRTARIVVSGATAKSKLGWRVLPCGKSTPEGFRFDGAEVKVISSVKRENTLRVMDYNIQNGMWADQGNNYDNFVKYIKSVDADVIIFCEAQSNYITGEEGRMPEPIDQRYLPKHWGELAARWGHDYWVIGAHQDNHPVVITSKYPIKLIQKLGGKEVSHGGVHAQITIGGETVNFVGFHTYPAYYGREVAVEERKASALRFDGEKFRAEEMKIFFERTILNPEYAGEKNWLIMGDTNSISPLDDRYYGYGLKSPFYWGHNYVLGTSSCIDLVKQYCCPGERDVMIPSTQSGRRIDIMYGTQVMAGRVIKVKTPREGFTKSIKRAGFRFHERSSDHLPVIVDFKWR